MRPKSKLDQVKQLTEVDQLVVLKQQVFEVDSITDVFTLLDFKDTFLSNVALEWVYITKLPHDSLTEIQRNFPRIIQVRKNSFY